MKIKFTLMLFVCAVTSVFAQTATINGKVLDKSNNSSIPYATIVIKMGENVITGGITDEKGEFSIDKIAYGNYDFEAQFIGYKSHSSKIIVKAKNLNVGTIYLSEDAMSLTEVEVVGERTTMEQKIDRKVINVGPDLINAGPTASDILNNIPSVSVDSQNNT
ncbi:MAG: TonB-dependent receptor, partial [Bacteroidetes bacterium HGW-Bacteroidetes-23]